MFDKMTPDQLQKLFLEELQKDDNFKYISGLQPFYISFYGKFYYVYIKNLSSAYFNDRPDTTRAQLPIKQEFNIIKQSSIPFIFLGYDIKNDVYVSWNYNVVKKRLNEKESVSFYSRESFQKQVKPGVFLRKKLKNEDIPVFFKRQDLISFFYNLENLFNDKVLEINNMDNQKKYENDGKIYKITEIELLKKIYTVVNDKTYNILKAINYAIDFYDNKYPNMKYSDWSNLIKGTIFNNSNRSFILTQNISDNYENINNPLSMFFDSLIKKSNKEFAITIFEYLFNNKYINQNLIKILCDKSEIYKEIGVSYPYSILLPINKNINLKSQVVISGQSRYYMDKIFEFENIQYVVTSQWYGPDTTKIDTKTPFINFIKRYLDLN